MYVLTKRHCPLFRLIMLLLLVVLLLLFSWPPVRELCPICELVMFQPRKRTPLDLGSVANFYVAVLLSTAPPFLPAAWCPPGGATRSCPFPIFIGDHIVPTQDHLTTRASPISVPAYQFPSPPESESATSSPPLPLPRLMDYQCCALDATQISSNIVLIFFRSAFCRRHGSRRLPPPS